MKYCPECGNTLESKRMDGVERQACGFLECGFVHWDNPVPVVAALIEYQGKIVLARNAQWPEGVFSLVTGYLERNETPEEAVVREVKEEVGLDGKAQAFLGGYSFNEKNQIILAHWVVATGALKTGTEITEVRLLSREELKLWQFGRLALTAAIVKQWLEQTTPARALQPMSPLPLGRCTSSSERQPMILEAGILSVKQGQEYVFERAFDEAKAVIASVPGFISLKLQRCLEAKNRYLLLVEWNTLEDHTVGFRESQQYQAWRNLLHHFYEPFPVVEHYEQCL